MACFPVALQQRFGLGQRFAFVIEAQRQMFVGRIQAGVAQPMRNRAQVHTGPQQMDRGAVAQTMRVQSLVFQTWHARDGLFNVFAQDEAHAKPGEPTAATVAKHGLGPVHMHTLFFKQIQKQS